MGPMVGAVGAVVGVVGAAAGSAAGTAAGTADGQAVGMEAGSVGDADGVITNGVGAAPSPLGVAAAVGAAPEDEGASVPDPVGAVVLEPLLLLEPAAADEPRPAYAANICAPVLAHLA